MAGSIRCDVDSSRVVIEKVVMPGLVPGIHVFTTLGQEQDVDGRAQASGSDAVLWTSMPGHDERMYLAR